MQIDLLVQFHKAVGDVNRIRMLTLLARQPLSGIELSEQLGVTPATITHHTQKLKKLGLLVEKREKNTIIFHLLPQEFKRYATAIIDTVFPPGVEPQEKWQFIREQPTTSEQPIGGDEMAATTDKQRVLASFFTPEGKLKSIPAQLKKRLYILEKLTEQLEFGRTYTEKEISEYFKTYHEDAATLRREMIMNHIMYRTDGIYTLNPRELWRTIK